ncbi:MAG TPA: superoxide dismutase family protein [Gammaproteobacteria bacterium]|jgi:Cu-Zn family superoxide dismutase|nr:superoxide dismutase family protein [Gammaproteobacteria bacterium]
MKKYHYLHCLFLANIFFFQNVFASVTVSMYETTKEGQGKSVGSVVMTETPNGLLLTPDLHDLSPGIHGFHIHQHPACENHGDAALGHFDPKNTGKHLGPYNDLGHLGDLPAIFVDANGKASLPILAPRLKRLSVIKNHALMIHGGGDNYSDQPLKLGGGGARMECGIIE